MSNPTMKIYRAPGATMPSRGSDDAAGYDLSACLITEDGCHSTAELNPGERMAIPTGIYVRVPDDHYGRVAPRSGLAFKNGIDVLAGVIDCDYTGEIKVILLNTGSTVFPINHKDRIAQLIIEKISNPLFVEVDSSYELGLTERGGSGFGSTG